MEEFNSHNCVKPKQNGVRCKLCGEGVYPNNEMGWKNHLIKEGCPNNNRST